MKVKTYATEVGSVISKSMIRLPECTIDPTEPATRVRFMVALLQSRDGPVWCLFYDQGGDWNSFGDGDEHKPEMIEAWMPDAIRECIKAGAHRLGDKFSADMDYFEDWANVAEKTLENSESEDERA